MTLTQYIDPYCQEHELRSILSGPKRKEDPMEPPCRETKIAQRFTHFNHSWNISTINGLETGLCGICGLLRMRVFVNYLNAASASAIGGYFYYQPMKPKKKGLF